MNWDPTKPIYMHSDLNLAWSCHFNRVDATDFTFVPLSHLQEAEALLKDIRTYQRDYQDGAFVDAIDAYFAANPPSESK